MTAFDLLIRFSFLFITIFIIYFIIIKRYNEHLSIYSLLICFCTFFLCLLFTHIELSIGIGFGLFAIFSILRFRAEAFSISSIIFIFVGITMSILDVLCPKEKWYLLLFIHLFLVGFYLLTSSLFKGSNYSKIFSFRIVNDGFLKLDKVRQIEYIQSVLHIDKFYYEIKEVDMIKNVIDIKIYINH
jgi:hypothetical protein